MRVSRKTAFDAVMDIFHGDAEEVDANIKKKYSWIENTEVSIDNPERFIILTEYEDVSTELLDQKNA